MGTITHVEEDDDVFFDKPTSENPEAAVYLTAEGLVGAYDADEWFAQGNKGEFVGLYEPDED